MYIIETILEGIADVIIILAVLAIAVIGITWVLQLNDMSGLQKLAFDTDVMINGEGVALFRNLENHLMDLVEIFKEML